jgi:hypothetical protein
LEFFVESILSHKSKIKMLSTFEFKVKWLGTIKLTIHSNLGRT